MQIYFMSAFLLCVAVFALRNGDQPEQSVAVLLLGSSTIDFLYHVVTGPPQFDTVDLVHLIIDAVVLSALLWVALNANRAWPLWVCGSQLIVMLGHVSKLYEVREVYRGYWVMTQVPFMLQLVLLLIGTAAHSARVRQVGRYHCWRLG